jgi:hypothetical protein
MYFSRAQTLLHPHSIWKQIRRSRRETTSLNYEISPYVWLLDVRTVCRRRVRRPLHLCIAHLAIWMPKRDLSSAAAQRLVGLTFLPELSQCAAPPAVVAAVAVAAVADTDVSTVVAAVVDTVVDTVFVVATILGTSVETCVVVAWVPSKKMVAPDREHIHARIRGQPMYFPSHSKLEYQQLGQKCCDDEQERTYSASLGPPFDTSLFERVSSIWVFFLFSLLFQTIARLVNDDGNAEIPPQKKKKRNIETQKRRAHRFRTHT